MVLFLYVCTDRIPICTSSDQGNDVSSITCGVGFRGNLAPLMSWTDVNGQPVTNATYTPTPTYVESTIHVSNTSVLGPFTCKTYFDAPTYAPPPSHVTPATDAPNYVYYWVSPSANYTGNCNLTHFR